MWGKQSLTANLEIQNVFWFFAASMIVQYLLHSVFQGSS